MMKRLRELNWAGPCLDIGVVVEETAERIKFIDRSGNMTHRRGAKVKWKVFHTDPCERCVDHPKTQYPNGYDS